MRFTFQGEIRYWHGPAPWYFIAVPEAACRALHAVSSDVSYGWGVIPATVRIGETEFTTSLFPKDGGYLVPIRLAVRRAQHLEEGDSPTVELTVRA
jgi:hypothetical protein